MQLASCLHLQREMSQPLSFVAFDDRLAEAARHEGLTVVPASKGLADAGGAPLRSSRAVAPLPPSLHWGAARSLAQQVPTADILSGKRIRTSEPFGARTESLTSSRCILTQANERATRVRRACHWAISGEDGRDL